MDGADVGLYVRLISGMILGLAIARLLTGSAKLVQHPDRYRFDAVHLLWVVVVLLNVVTFWWYEARGFGTVVWSFHLYLFQILYCGTFLFLAALVLPEDIDGFEDYYAYFLARRKWFFGLLAFNYVLSVFDTALKDNADYEIWSLENLAFDAFLLGIFVLAMHTASRRFHMILVSTAVGLFVLSTLTNVVLDVL